MRGTASSRFTGRAAGSSHSRRQPTGSLTKSRDRCCVCISLVQECVRNSEIQKRIVRRIELFSELGYYQRKVNELRSEREARAGKGKPESASDIDKFQRNQKKLGQNTHARSSRCERRGCLLCYASLLSRSFLARLSPCSICV